LLRPVAAKPAATAGCDNKRIGRIHCGILPEPEFFRQTNGFAIIIGTADVALQNEIR
jgi:hypothetical protein